MKRRKKLKNKKSVFRVLFEQVDEESPEEDEEELEDSGDPDEKAEDPSGEENADKAAEDSTATEEEEDEDLEITPEDQYSLSDSLDNELESLLLDFEQEARKSAEINLSETSESYSIKFLNESYSEDIDLRSFASNIARLVKNYMNLIDWETVILNKAEMFTKNNYGEETAIALLDILDQDFGIAKNGTKEELPETPVAVGATEAGS